MTVVFFCQENVKFLKNVQKWEKVKIYPQKKQKYLC